MSEPPPERDTVFPYDDVPEWLERLFMLTVTARDEWHRAGADPSVKYMDVEGYREEWDRRMAGIFYGMLVHSSVADIAVRPRGVVNHPL